MMAIFRTVLCGKATPPKDALAGSLIEWYGGQLIAESIAPHNKPLIKAGPELLDALTGHEDPSLWRVNWVAGMLRQYEREHDWESDEDADATRQAIETVKEFCELSWKAIAKAKGQTEL